MDVWEISIVNTGKKNPESNNQDCSQNWRHSVGRVHPCENSSFVNAAKVNVSLNSLMRAVSASRAD